MNRQPLEGPNPPHFFSRHHDHTFRHTTLGRTPLDEWSARLRDLYQTTHNTHKRQTSMSPVGFFFLPVGGFSPLIHFLYCLNPFVLHVTLRSILPSLQQTQHKHLCPRWDIFCLSGFFPFDPFLYCLNPFVLHVTLRSILPSLQQTQHRHLCPGGIFFF
jgi:hypothetical protein